MTLRKLLLKPIKFYKYFISPLLGNNCRYYPTCSEYAVWEIENDNLLKAVFKIIFRILRCNQFFRGGIDYPVIKKNFTPIIPCTKPKIKYFFIPKEKEKNKFYIIKVNDE